MFKRILLFLICATFSVLSIVHAQGEDLTFSKLESGLITVENPFKSQLPKIEKPKIEMPDKPLKPPKGPTTEKPVKKPKLPKPIATPLVTPKRPLPNVTINGIIWNSNRPQAIINGRIVDIGDTISEIQIIDIQKTGIDGLFDGKNVTLQP